MERINSEGIPRHQLKFALSRTSIVKKAKATNSCLLCRGPHVNDAGLCDVCYAMIQDPDEQRMIQLWLTGEGP